MQGDIETKIDIYHGSDHIIEKPLFGEGKPYNDYGLGFYCTESIDMAKEWAVGESSNGFANCYTINCKALSILNLCNKDYSTRISCQRIPT